VEKERGERRKIRKRTKAAGGPSSSSTAARAEASGDVEMSDATTVTASATATTSNDENTSTQDKGKALPGGDLEDEGIYRAKEATEFEALVDSSLKNDLGCSTTGFYELVAIVTHKGAAADSGHYIGFVKKSVFYEARAKAKELNAVNHDLGTALEEFRRAHSSDSSGNVAPLSDPALVSILGGALGPAAAVPSQSTSATTDQERDNNGPTESNSAPVSGSSTSVAALEAEEDEDWYKFDDDKVSDFPKEKLPTLEGGGEDSSAYVLVYRSKVL